MLSNNQHISISNYEEWFILYMDNELSADQKKEVEAFLLLHPNLQEELDLLLGTKLPAEDILFSGKEDLQAASMKLNVVDENLLLYIDNELPAAGRRKVEERLSSEKDFRLQYDILQQTKMDAAEVIPYPNKKELYRYAEHRVLLPVWMRIAAAVVLLLMGGYFFVLDEESTSTVMPNNVTVSQKQPETKKLPAAEKPVQETVVPQQQDMVATTIPAKKTEPNERNAAPVLPLKEIVADQPAFVQQTTETVAIQEGDAVQIDVKKLLTEPTMALNNSVAKLPVTSAITLTYNETEAPAGPAVTDGDDKENHRTPAKGFLRKVSRFIERRTGIGTVNADNELLIGAVSLKLN